MGATELPVLTPRERQAGGCCDAIVEITETHRVHAHAGSAIVRAVRR